MTITINTNVSSLIAQGNLTRTQEKLDQALNRLSSGKRINEAKDDSAGLAISENMTAIIRGLGQGSKNGNDAISLIQTAESGMNETMVLMQRMRELATQASTGTYSSSNLTNLNTEYQALLGEIQRVSTVTSFNGINVLQGGSVTIQIGSQNTTNDQLTVTLTDTSTTSLLLSTTDLSTSTDAQTAMTALDTAISTVTTGLATLGAIHSNISEAVKGNDDRATALSAARSRIVDTDYAEESSKLAQAQVMQQSGVSMLAQANASGQIALKLLQG